MTESLITHLRHVDLAVPDYERQLAFYTGAWGLTTVASDRDIAFLAAEGSPERYVIRLRRDPAKRLDLVSFGAASARDVDTLADHLIGKGLRLAAEPTSLKTEGGGYGLRFFDLDGRTVEVSAEVATRQHRKIEERESIPVRLSHVVLNSTDPDATARWYSGVLGFRLSDTLAGPEMGTVMNFMRCNPGTTRSPSPAARTSRCTTSRSSCAASTSSCAARAACSGPARGWSGAPAVTWPARTPSPTSSTRITTRSNTPPSSPSSTRTPGTRTSTTCMTTRCKTSGARRTR
jgi:catechol 2,3-dioxygenase-like lactoylglutathione lyase family enzyme